eukprot:scaffold113843_cov57-Attheya_sp.AAC.3
MLFAHILDAEVVDYQTEGDGVGLMREAETGDALGLDVSSRRLEMLDEAVVGQDFGLGKAIHALSNFDHNVAIGD